LTLLKMRQIALMLPLPLVIIDLFTTLFLKLLLLLDR